MPPKDSEAFGWPPLGKKRDDVGMNKANESRMVHLLGGGFGREVVMKCLDCIHARVLHFAVIKLAHGPLWNVCAICNCLQFAMFMGTQLRENAGEKGVICAHVR